MLFLIILSFLDISVHLLDILELTSLMDKYLQANSEVFSVYLHQTMIPKLNKYLVLKLEASSLCPEFLFDVLLYSKMYIMSYLFFLFLNLDIFFLVSIYHFFRHFLSLNIKQLFYYMF